MSTGSEITFMPGKPFISGGRTITSVVYIQHEIIRRDQSFQHGSEMRNQAVRNQILLIDGCIEYCEHITPGRRVSPQNRIEIPLLVVFVK